MKELIEKLITDGWAVFNIPDPDFIFEAIAWLEAESCLITGCATPLSEMHDYVRDWPDYHARMTHCLWEREFSAKFGRACLPLLKELIGCDLMIQHQPYLRVARPGHAEDNIGFHKDSQYGQTPYELVLHVPFVDLEDGMALRVISGSHIVNESEYPSEPKKRHEKGSPMHRAGFPYAPRVLTVPQGKETMPLTMKVGQVAVFFPTIFHGQEVNNGRHMRVTTDLRVVATNRCRSDKIGTGQNQYVPLSVSPVTFVSTEYYEAQK